MRRCGIFLENHMRICPAEAEAADTSPSRQRIAVSIDHMTPGFLPLGDMEGAARKFQIGVEVLAVQGTDDHAVPHLQQNLDEPCNPGGKFQMTDVRLHRAYGTALRGDWAECGFGISCEIREGSGQGLNLYGIPKRRPGAMSLDVADCSRVDAGLPVGRSQQVGLRLRIRSGQ